MSEALHDNPTIWPTLPARHMDDKTRELLVEPNRGTVWETCWEYVATHNLTDTEGSAFWHGANLVYEAMREGRR